MATPSLAHHTSAPAITWTVPDTDLTEAFIELEVVSSEGTLPADNGAIGGMSVVFAGVSSLVTWSYSQEDANKIAKGGNNTFDLYSTDQTGRRKIAAGHLWVDSVGELSLPGSGVVQVPGLPGPPFGVWRGEWAAGGYDAISIVRHDNSLWWTPASTDTEPGAEGSVWVLWVDGSSIADDRAAAVAAAESASASASAAADDRTYVEEARAAVAVDRGVVEDSTEVAVAASASAANSASTAGIAAEATYEDRLAVATDKMAVSTAKAAVDIAKADVDLATTNATNAAAATAADVTAVAADRAAVNTAKGQVDTAKAAVDIAKGQVDTAKTAVDTAKGLVDTATTTATNKAGEAATSATNAATDRAAVQTIYAAVTAPPITVATTTYTLSAADAGRMLRCTHASGCVVTLPNDLDSSFLCSLRRVGGPVTWVTAAGATKHEFPPGTGIAAQWGSVLVEIDSNVGGLAAAYCIGGAIG